MDAQQELNNRFGGYMIGIKNAVWLALAFVVAGCVSATQEPQSTTKTTGPQTYLFAYAMWNDPVFARDVKSHRAALQQSGRGLSDARAYGFGGGLTPASEKSLTAGLKHVSGRARNGVDVVVATFTSHGIKGAIAVKPGKGDSQVAQVNGPTLRSFLQPLEQDLHIVVLQACHSGSLIPALSHPNRVIITASAADRKSFGCNPTNSNTWFMRELNKQIRAGGSWEEIFARTKGGIRATEKAQGIRAEGYSNPQVQVGANMRRTWRQG